MAAEPMSRDTTADATSHREPIETASRREVAEAALADAERSVRSKAAPFVPNAEVERDAEPDPHSIARAIVLRQLTLGPRSRASWPARCIGAGATTRSPRRCWTA